MMRSPTPEEIKALQAFVRKISPKASVRTYKSAMGASVNIHPPYKQDGGGEEYVQIADYLMRHGWVVWPEGSTSSLEKMKGNAKTYNAFYSIGNLMQRDTSESVTDEMRVYAGLDSGETLHEWSLLEADAIATNNFDTTKLARDIVYGYLRNNHDAQKTGVLYVHWKSKMQDKYHAMLQASWPQDAREIEKKIPGEWEYPIFHDVHNEFDSDWNDGEPYKNNDPKTAWSPDARAWYAEFMPKLKAAKITIGELIISPKSGLPGFKVTMSPAPEALPKYKGKSKLNPFH